MVLDEWVLEHCSATPTDIYHYNTYAVEHYVYHTQYDNQYSEV